MIRSRGIRHANVSRLHTKWKDAFHWITSLTPRCSSPSPKRALRRGWTEHMLVVANKQGGRERIADRLFRDYAIVGMSINPKPGILYTFITRCAGPGTIN